MATSVELSEGLIRSMFRGWSALALNCSQCSCGVLAPLALGIFPLFIKEDLDLPVLQVDISQGVWRANWAATILPSGA
ncbi:MAG: hypothetical protein IIC24_10455 [Chloroflexi bacterium]|nr:hypothetical protein [Chloroflexota bacterium]